MDVAIRLLTLGDAEELAALHQANRAFNAPTEPHRDEDFYTAAGQRTSIERALASYEAGASVPFAIVVDGSLAGQITLSHVVRGPLQSANVGYWVAEHLNGRGVASAATAAMVRHAFDELGLHRLEAGTLLDNHGSQRVLTRNGFEQFGMAPRFLHIAGEWRDHLMFQLINEDWTP